MIVREYASCDECGTVHVLRIGIGSEPVQAHQFACQNCRQEMGITLKNKGGFAFGPNATRAAEDDTGPIVNLNPNFVFTKENIRRTDAFPSLEHGRSLVNAALEARRRLGLPEDLLLLSRMPPRVRVTEEWPPLRAAWSLTRNGKADLAQKRLDAFIGTAGYMDTPTSIQD